MGSVTTSHFYFGVFMPTTSHIPFDLDPPEIDRLKKLNAAYRSGKPLVTDDVYDKYYFSAKEKYADHEFFTNVQPEAIAPQEEIQLPYVMGSLENFHLDDLHTWIAKNHCSFGYVLTWKLDGVSILAEYRDGVMAMASTRGDGKVGKNISDKALQFLPNKLLVDHKGRTIVRGEMLLNADPVSLGYKNRRNAVTGIISRDDGKHLQYIRVIFYEVLEYANEPTSDSHHSTQVDQLLLIGALGLECVEFELLIEMDADKIAPYIEQKIQNFDNTQYDIDGVVVVPNRYIREDVALPKGKIAYKAEGKAYETIVKSVDYETSRLGRVIPVVHYDPLDVGGVTMSKATAHNAGFILNKCIVPGTKIIVKRAQEVIPYIAGVIDVTANQTISIIDKCPSCGNSLVWDDNNVHLLCQNAECPPQVLKRLSHFFLSLGLEEFSEKSFSNLNVTSIEQVFKLNETDITKIEGWGETSASDFVKRISECKVTTPELFIKALGIPTIGKSIAKWLTSKYTFDQIRRLEVSDLLAIDGIGPGRANLIVDGMRSNSNLIDKLLTIMELKVPKDGPLKGKTICITGALSRPRKFWEKTIEENDGTSSSSVKSVEGMILVCNEESTSGKYQKAKKLGIPILSEEQLVELITRTN